MYRAAGCFSATNRAGSITGLTVAQPIVLNRTSASETRASAMASNLPRGTDLFLNVVATLRRFKATWSNAAKRPVAAEAEGVAKDRIGPEIGRASCRERV